MMKFHASPILILVYATAVVSVGERPATDLSKEDENQLLLLSTLDGTVICVEGKTGHVRWKLKDEPVIRVPLKGDSVPMPLFLPDPKDGSLYVLGSGDREAVKKLPFTIPQLVASSPCRSTDGIIYTGKKLDTWFSVNPQNGAKKTFLSFDSADMSCPREGPDSIFIGRTEYNLVMMDSRKKEKTWNVTFYDYTSFSMDPENVQNYDYVHFTGSSSGRVVTLHHDSDSILWRLDHDSPVIAMYLLQSRGLLNVPFTNVAESTLDQLIDELSEKKDSKLGIEFKTSQLKLFPTLYIGEYLHGLYALPSLADRNTAMIAFDQGGPLLLEGPTARDEDSPPQRDTRTGSKFKIITRKYSSKVSALEEIRKKSESNADQKALSFIFLGHYKVPNVNNYIALQIEGRADKMKISENSSSDAFRDGNKSSRVSMQADGGDVHSPRFYWLQLCDVVLEIHSLNVSYAQLKSLARLSWNLLTLTILQQQNLEIKVTIAGLIVGVLVMARHFNKQMKDIQQLSRSSRSSDSSTGSGVTTTPEDSSSGTVQIGKIKLNTSEVLGKGCEGTFVFRGEFDARSVAVKRILPECFNFADREVELLRESDQHENVIRYYCMEQDKQFRYLALELCAATLQEYVEEKYTPENITPMEILYQATRGLQHLHALNIVHRDIKPNNVLLSMPDLNGQVHAMISDFGLCKKLKLGRSSFSRRSGVIGTDGWIAPEMLTGDTRTTCSVDVFSLGCVYYYVLTKGGHPFGDSLHRQANIISGSYTLNGFEREDHLAAHLIERMIDGEGRNRPRTSSILKHPLFWSEAKTLNFFQDVSDRVEKESEDNWVLTCLERNGERVVRGDWRTYIDDEVAQNLRKYRSYRGGSVRDLLRALRNKKHHFRELSEEARRNLGEIPLGFVRYWTTRFPLLLLHTWLAMQCVKEEVVFSDYYDAEYVFPALDEDRLGPCEGVAETNHVASPGKAEEGKWTKPNGGNFWYRSWLLSNCTDEDALNKWRESEAGNEGGDRRLMEMMARELWERTEGEAGKKARNFSPKKGRPGRKAFVKKLREVKEQNSFWMQPS